MSSDSQIKIVLGTATFGASGQEQARVQDVNEVRKILEVFRQHGYREVDTARFYSGGTSEEYLGQLGERKQSVAISTKLYPTKAIGQDITHSPEDLREHLEKSLAALNTKKLDIWYLHGPDRSTPYETTLRTVNELYQEDRFERFGLSNFMSWEVAEIIGICEKHGWVKPTFYQGGYSALSRNVEPELFPCLRKFGISFYAYSPLAGGFLVGNYATKDTEVSPGSRFDNQLWQGQMHRRIYWNDAYFDALAVLRPVVEQHDLTLAEVALRWLSHHSLLEAGRGDAVVIGASSIEHVEENIVDLEKGPLPEDVLQAVEEAWLTVKARAPRYWH